MLLGVVGPLACGSGVDSRSAEKTGAISQADTCSQYNYGTSCTPSGGATTQLGIADSWPSPAVVSGSNDLSLPGSGSVGPDGQYHYTLPLDVPEGRMGMGPKLALNYSSGAGNGVLGVGWSLSGLSSIMPCPQIQAIDKQSYPVTMSGNDVLCLDGVRLFSSDQVSYQTELESYSQITRYTDGATGTPAFRVQSQDGLTRLYKQRGENKMTGKGLVWLLDTEYDANGNAVSYAYNDLTASSIPNVGIGGVQTQIQEFSIGSITYTNRMVNGIADTSGMRTVAFHYVPRKDTVSMRYGASNPDPHCTPANYCNQPAAVDVRTTQLLYSIDMWAPVPTLAAGEVSQMVWTYTFGYTPSQGTGRNLLTTVDKHGWQGGGNTLTRTFNYQSSSGLDSSRWSRTNVIAPFETGDIFWQSTNLGQQVAYADLLHDGRTEILMDTGGSSIWVGNISSSGLSDLPLYALPATLTGTQIVDLNGDGVPEIVAPGPLQHDFKQGPQLGDTYAVRTLNVASGVYSIGLSSVSFFDNNEYYNGVNENPAITDQGYANLVPPVFSPLFFTDSEGTGLPTGIWGHHAPAADPTCFFCIGFGCLGALLMPPPVNGCLEYTWSTVPVSGTSLGQPVQFYQDVAASASEPQMPLPNAPFGYFPRYHTMSLGDGYAEVLFFSVNGPDLVSNGAPSTSVPWLAWTKRNMPLWAVENNGAPYFAPNYSTSLDAANPGYYWAELKENSLTVLGDFDGRSVTEEYRFTPSILPPGQDSVAADWLVRAMDVDGDGHADVVAYHLSGASGTIQVDTAFLIRWDATGHIQTSQLSDIPVVVADFDGDGITDMLGGTPADLSGSGPVFYKGYRPASDYLSTVADKNASMLESTYYTRQPTSAPSAAGCDIYHYPAQCIPGGMNVVSSRMINTGAAWDEHDYTYGTARRDLLGRGFLGFDWVDDFEPTRPAETITYYSNKSPLINGAYLGTRPQKVTRYVPTAPVVGQPTQGIPVRATSQENLYNAFVTTGSAYTVQNYKWESYEYEYTTTLNWGSGAPHFGSPPYGQSPVRARVGAIKYDSYGNVTDSKVITTGGITTETKTDYYPATATPFLRSLVQDVYLYSYDPSTVTNPTARYVTYTYDAAGREHTEVTNNQSMDETVQRTTTYSRTTDGVINRTNVDAFGTNSNGYYQEPTRSTIVYLDTYEGMFPAMTKDSLGHLRHMLVNPTYGVVQQAFDENNVETRVVIDDFGREVSRSNAAGTTVSTSYARWLNSSGYVQGTLVSTTSGLASQASIRALDARGHTVLTATPHIYGAFDVSATSYDALGRATQQFRPQTVWYYVPGAVPSFGNGSTVTAYDPLDRVVSVTTPDTQVTSTSYTFLTSTTTDPSGHQSQVTKDLDGRVTQTVQLNTTPGGYNAVVSYQYGQFGQASSITQNSGPTWWMTYDLLGRRTSLQDPDSGKTTWAYNGFGDVLNETRAAGSASPVSTTYTYDPLGRVTTVAYSDGGVATYTYDTVPMGIGKLAQAVSDDFVVTNYGYDSLGRPDYTEWLVPTGNETSQLFNTWSSYDNQGRVSTVTYPYSADFWTVRITAQDNYDGWSGGLQTVTENGATLWQVGDRYPDGSLYYGYDANGDFIYRAYDANGRVTLIEDQTPAGADIVNLGYSYFPDGTTQSVTDSATGNGRTEYYGYDSLHQLTNWSVGYGLNDDWNYGLNMTGYTYDPFGNLTTVKLNGWYTEYNTYGGQSYISQQTQGYGPHQLAGQYYYAQGTGPAYAYDPSGRQTYAWSVRNQVSYKNYDLPKSMVDSQGRTTTFVYDANHNRVRKSGGAAGTTTFTLGGLFEARLNSAGWPSEYVMYVPGTDGMTTQLSNAPWVPATVNCMHPDKLGNVVAITSSAPGQNEYYYYDPFGRRADVTGQATSVGVPDVQVGFTGQQMDDDLGLINMRGRVYDPVQRRFLSMDPHVTNPLNALSYNPYTYVLNSPTNGTDPTGFDGEFDGADYSDDWVGDTNYFNGYSGTYSDSALPAVTPPPATPEMGMALTPTVWDLENTPASSFGAPAPVPENPLPHITTADEIATTTKLLQILAAGGSTYWQNIIPSTIHYDEPSGRYLGTPYPKGVAPVEDNTVGGSVLNKSCDDACFSAGYRDWLLLQPSQIQMGPDALSEPLPPPISIRESGEYDFSKASEAVRYANDNRRAFGSFTDGLQNITKAMDTTSVGPAMRQEIWSNISADMDRRGYFDPWDLRAAHISAFEHNGVVPIPTDTLWVAGAWISGQPVGNLIGPPLVGFWVGVQSPPPLR
jgi:RHS repeat-associated protein